MSERIVVQLLKPHILGGRQCSPGEKILVGPGTSQFLIQSGRAIIPGAIDVPTVQIDIPKKPTPRKRKPLKPKTS